MILCAALLSGLSIWLLKRPGSPSIPDKTRENEKLRGIFANRSSRNPIGDAEEYAKLIHQLSALLRAGSSNRAALEILEKIWGDVPGSGATDIHAGCLRALTQIRTGGTLRAGLAAHALTSKQQPRLWVRLSWCFAISERSGAALADLLDQLAGEIESAADMRRALDVALAGPRATSRLLTFLPMVGLGLGQLLGINPVAVLTTHPMGQIALLMGVLLWTANRWWCHLMLTHIIRQVPT